MSTANNQICVDIKKTILELIKDLKDNVFVDPIEQGEMAIVAHFFSKRAAHDVAQHVIAHVLPHEKQILSRNLDFFVSEKNNIFKELPQDRVDYFADLVKLPETAGGLSEIDKSTAWSYFDTLVSLAKKMKKNI